jgi:NitT/TauT family transport system substrate-binding protein
VPGGPNVNNRILLPVGKLDFFMSANTLQSFDAIEQSIPTLAVASMFQKDPQVLMAHPGEGVGSRARACAGDTHCQAETNR